MAKPAVEVTIEEIGARGDGIARLDDGRRVFVPFVLPGERVAVRLQAERGDGIAARLIEVIEASVDRTTPACAHFGVCGGCALQHQKETAYRGTKLRLLENALARQGIQDVPISALHVARPGERRRTDLSAVRRRDDLLLGFNERGSHRIIDVLECPVLDDRLVRLVGELRATLFELLRAGDKADVVVNLTDAGADVLLVTKASFGASGRSRLAGLAADAGLARVARRHPDERGAEVIAELAKPVVTLGAVPVVLPPGGFQQATAAGAAILSSFVVEALAASRRVADLYAGAGTFTFALSADGRTVHAVEGERNAIEALASAAKAAGLSRVSAERRDLGRRPLRVDELARFDGVVFDPPRAGAREQAQEISASRVGRVAAVSCNPATFARDARILLDGGYRLERILPVDQFLWSPHLELAALFTRD